MRRRDGGPVVDGGGHSKVETETTDWAVLAEIHGPVRGVWLGIRPVAFGLVDGAWRRVIMLAVTLLGFGVLLVVVVEGGVWEEIGIAFVGGSVVGLVFAIVQYTLDQQASKRQAEGEVQLTVNASSDLDGIGLRGATLSNAYLWRKRFTSANLDGARLDGVDLRESDLTNASLQEADLRGADLRGAVLTGAVLDGADLSGARLDAIRLRSIRMVGARLVDADIHATDSGSTEAADPRPPTAGVDLSRARLDRARLSDVQLTGLQASFMSAVGMNATGAGFRDGDLSCADLRAAGLSRADLRDCDLSGADLRRAVLAGADLRGARLVGARLVHTDLTGAVVDGADLRRCDLRGAFLTNVELAEANLAGAWVLPRDLRRAAGAPEPDDLEAVVAEVQPASDEGADVPSEISAPAWARRRRRRARTRLTVVAGASALRPLAQEVAGRLRQRRQGLDRITDDIEGIVVDDGPPDVGDPEELGLPDRVTVGRRPPWRGPYAVLRPYSGGVEVELRRLDGPSPSGPPPDQSSACLASWVQLAVAGPGPFTTWAELDAFGRWLEQPGQDALVPALDHVLALNPRNPVALLLRAWVREVGDAEAAIRASEELRTVWAASLPGMRRALAAARLGLVQGQLIHRTSMDPARPMARARAAGDESLALFDLIGGGRSGLGLRHSQDRRTWLARRNKAEYSRAVAAVVRETAHGLDEGIQRLGVLVRELEAAGLPVSPAVRNSLAYCLMARLGRFTAGPGEGYGEAVVQLRLVLADFGVCEQYCAGEAGVCAACGQPLERPFEVDEEHCVGETPGEAPDQAGALSVQGLARWSAAGEAAGFENRLRRRREVRLALANLGNLYRLFKRFDAALNCYGAALYCEPHYVEAYGERAWVRLEQADEEGAARDVEHALAVPFGTDQQRAHIILDYIDALARVGRARDQRPWIERVQQLDPESEKAGRLAREWKARFVDDDAG